jgi:hypothetical protein
VSAVTRAVIDTFAFVIIILSLLSAAALVGLIV